ncbi:MAG TPA: hypothetical protein VEM37_06425, partial [Nitrospiraceae bacterium]|nr:hypothetical protein [Nitrospiraceae bacterium]
ALGAGQVSVAGGCLGFVDNRFPADNAGIVARRMAEVIPFQFQVLMRTVCGEISTHVPPQA